MIIRRKGGLTEFIPSPQEKREGLIRDHVLGLVENLHQRIERLERKAGLPAEEAKAFTDLFRWMKTDESRNLKVHNSQIIDGIVNF
ncbi:MAG: VrlD [Bacteroidetes bacterium]|nr:VrlD [Bacteroidota bacterium]